MALWEKTCSDVTLLAVTEGCTYLFSFFFPAAILYAVLQANNVGLLCSVLYVPFLLSPDIPAS